MTIDEIVKGCYRPYFRDRCEQIRLRNELGASLRPSQMFPVGTCGPNVIADFSEPALLARDQSLSAELIDWLSRLRSDFPEIAAEFDSDLASAEKVWKSFVAA